MLLVRFDPDTGTDLGAVDPARPAGQHQNAARRVLPERKDQRRLHDRQQAGGVNGGIRARRRNDRARSVPRPEAQRHRRRQLRGLHQGRRHARLRVRATSTTATTTSTAARPKRTTRASTCSRATRSSATTTRSTTCATATPTRTSCASRASRTSCATLREQVYPGNVLGQIEHVAKAVGHAIRTTLQRLGRPSCSSSPS